MYSRPSSYTSRWTILALCINYINAGSGRTPALADLAKTIRLAEARLGIESIAVHLPGELNVTADGLSRLQLSADKRDRRAEKCLRRRLFKHIKTVLPVLDVDGMASDDGHNSQLEQYRCPSEFFFRSRLRQPLLLAISAG